ncbi:hypothetical protein GGR26_000597 [Lewinella marina]|uniref:Uncharacterized protein n=1 Tax=Neolewinella marina TaxID=438751 RepID=A0A2G0CJ40_9BACT|nr:hypothetical protein [Neolewinella marina]NJB84852.1 hypothetical protein [Neolewinella marina]PHK99992.1 hypothetical protein CGL56_02815 [Neolewinella marina]
MKSYIYFLFLLLGVATLFTSCGDSPEREGEIDPAETVETAPDYEDDDQDGDGNLEFEEQSPFEGGITTRTTNYARRADSIRMAGDTLVDAKYTDNEYKAAFTTATTNPKNQVAGGVTPGNNQKKQ